MNQRVLITAGASGIGLAIGQSFAAAGAKVFVCDLNEKGLNDLKQATPGVMTGVCDVSKRDSIEKMMATGFSLHALFGPQLGASIAARDQGNFATAFYIAIAISLAGAALAVLFSRYSGRKPSITLDHVVR